MAEATWEACLAAALTGAAPVLPAPPTADLLADLAGVGWTPAAIAAHAEAVWAAGGQWPHPAGAAVLARFGSARWQATLAEMTSRLGLDVTVRPPSRRRHLNADERRLLAEAPPHHGA
jgi:hypothetical protein